jgi:hypothetical protein
MGSESEKRLRPSIIFLMCLNPEPPLKKHAIFSESTMERRKFGNSQAKSFADHSTNQTFKIAWFRGHELLTRRSNSRSIFCELRAIAHKPPQISLSSFSSAGFFCVGRELPPAKVPRSQFSCGPSFTHALLQPNQSLFLF